MRHLVTGGEHPVWTPDLWDDVRYDNNGRARVSRPDYPEAYADGYALRYRVVWWLATGKVVPQGMDLHHRNGVRDDDRFENLELLDHVEHSRLHNPVRVVLVCEHCGRTWREPKHPRRRFCSQSCYHAHPRSAESRAAISAGLQGREVSPETRAKIAAAKRVIGPETRAKLSRAARESWSKRKTAA